ncbi:hypothetical protein L226DRAFT_535029 [Lentinus tigrinus ALCF2SS1-7]|uniref:Uncharacterized protein n=1 Tax=Lentinus tigrinus ALCF2SS1-6 TaxID=1328759 RepID=A0A5C2S8N0_9APHY|nr:hypothetical protein L227DRAFT_575627 [Lentinus tigrinus ALCF2SS1-6]RPD74805.1 hypothetical protein L226DRAFT_535029 [Lentinus tigrinus ALCF2SS1-7]
MLRRSGGTVKTFHKPGWRFYSGKVRAFPFVVSKERAIQELSVNTAVSTAYKTVGTYLRRYFPSMNIDALRPTRVEPVYLPTWLIDARVQATLWLKKTPEQSEFNKDDVEVQFAHTCMPGFCYRPLSEYCLATTDLLEAKPVEWSEDMRNQDGDNVLCLPFTLSPFQLAESARHLSMADANVSDIIRFEPSSLREIMMAAYPVLIPIWLAQFVVQAPVNGRRQDVVLTSFIEAGRSEPRIYIELLPVVETLFNLLGLKDTPDLLVRGSPVEYPPRWTNVRSILGNHATLEHRKHIEDWIDLSLCKGVALAKYREQHFSGSKGTVDWEDVRIRPFTLEERAANLQWLGTAENLFVLEKMLEFYGQKHENKARQDGAALSDPNSIEVTQEQIQSIQDKIDTLKKEREEKKPGWLTQYEIQQRLLAETPRTEASQ